MSTYDIIAVAQWVFLTYFLMLNGGYIVLNFLSLFGMREYFRASSVDSLPKAYSEYELPISIIVPAYNEAATITASVRALLQLRYPEYEIVVINDGSKDETLDVLMREFSLVTFPEAYRERIPTQAVNAVYVSTRFHNLRVVDKNNGGKADALNAGINCARYPLFCGVDADSVLQPDSLYQVLQPFLDDSRTVACGGTIRIANGCTVRDGFVEKIALSDSTLALFQTMEYLRAFLFGRLGWSPLNALLIISGAFGLFRKEVVVSVGGYRTDTVGEDMELVVRMHRKLREQRLARQQAKKLDSLFEQMTSDEVSSLNIVVKADVQGSVEALRDALTKLSNDEVEVNMKVHLLGPGVEDRGEPHLAAEVLGISTQLFEGARDSLEEQSVEAGGVCPEQRIEFVGDGDDRVEVGCGKDLLHALGHPLCTPDALALGAVAIAAGVVGGLRVAARVTHLEVAAESRCAAALDVA